MKPALLYLVHRIPFPPNKGDKVRSFHLLRQLSKNYRVFLGAFVDDEQDWQYVGELDKYCQEVKVLGLNPRVAKLLCARALLTGEAMTLPYYRNAQMSRWVEQVVAANEIKRSVVFSSSMAQYLAPFKEVRAVVDFCDVDSAKWTRYAADHKGVMAWLYRREGERLAKFERAVAQQCAASVLVSQAEAELFKQVAPESVASTYAISNGVDSDNFSPEHDLPSPYSAGERPVVMTGAMNYWPNVDAAIWFAREIWPAVLAKHPRAKFYVVGMNPTEEVKALGQIAGVVVTGSVPDVRPYLRYARAVVAPLRVARGIQNKILEAMSMSRPVIASDTCAVGVDAQRGVEFLVAANEAEYQTHLDTLLNEPEKGDAIGVLARARVVSRYSWEAHLSRFDALIDPI